MRFIKPLQMFVAAAVLLGLVHTAICQFTDAQNHFHKFIYDRGPFQHVTLFLACFVIVLLLNRVSQYLSNRKQFTLFQEKKGQPPWELAQPPRVDRFPQGGRSC